MLNKKGQIGETLTWIVATILIIIMMIFFIFGASFLGGTKSVVDFRPGIFSKTSYEGSAPFLTKSLITYVSLKSELKKISVDKTLYKMATEEKFSLDYNQTKDEIVKRYSQK